MKLSDNETKIIDFWLHSVGENKHTLEAYSREVHRLKIWMKYYRPGLSLQNFNLESANAYLNFLQELPITWIKSRKPSKSEVLSDTQLFVSMPTEKTIAHTRKILVIFFSYLVRADFVPRNVFELSMKPSVPSDETIQRFISVHAWSWLWTWINHQDRKNANNSAKAALSYARVRWLFTFLYHTGIRREEVANARMADIQLHRLRDLQIWKIKVLGKGNKVRYVTLNSEVMEELTLYRANYDLPPYPQLDEDLPVVMSLSTSRLNDILTPRTIGFIIQETIAKALIDCRDITIQSEIKAMSTHWLRHTNATHRLMSGASLLTTQDELGHSDLRTTRKYVHSADTERYLDAEKLISLYRNKPES